ncbi:macrophage mannose receptor 1-like, partial [Poeciliopsis prolifica]|uniref:macrophage mannose receptor 1-like n=1 Tax=Poeciliopsis prolifica TaxID=188132 RepID=UPI00241408BE
FWHDYNCGFEFGSICKRSSSPPVNATVAPTVPPQGNCKEGWKRINSKCLKWRTPNRDLWIGIHCSYGNGFYWTDGRPKSYVNLDNSLYIAFRNEKKCAVINGNPSYGLGKWIPKSCNDTNGFICLSGLQPNTPETTTLSNPDNYFKILNDSIKLVTQQKSWSDAQKTCEADGAKLVSVRSEWTQAYIELLALNLKRPLWIGLNKNQTNNYFQYIEGWPLLFTRWDRNEPRIGGICVYVDVNGKWKTSDCNHNFGSVCMKSTDTPPEVKSDDYPGICPEDPYPGRTGYGASAFIWPKSVADLETFQKFLLPIFSEEKEWQDATTSCLSHGGTLASIGDPWEQDFILNNIKTFQNSYTSYWLGLFKTTKGEWMWLDKTVMDFENWREYPIYYFGMISVSDGKWHTGFQWQKRPYICKAAKVLPPKPSPKPNVAIDPQGRGHTALVAVFVIAGIAMGAGIAFFLFKKSGRQMTLIPIPGGLTAFDNPLFSSNQSQKNLVDTKKLLGNADEDNSQPVITI